MSTYVLRRIILPFSANNPNKNRNYVVAVLAVVTCFAIIMGGYFMLASEGKDTESYMRFLTLLIVTFVPSLIAAYNSTKAKEHSKAAAENTTVVTADAVKSVAEVVEEKLNGTLDERLRQANIDTLDNAHETEGGTGDSKPAV